MMNLRGEELDGMGKGTIISLSAWLVRAVRTITSFPGQIKTILVFD